MHNAKYKNIFLFSIPTKHRTIVNILKNARLEEHGCYCKNLRLN